MLARLDGGEEVIIEVQYEMEAGFIKRLLYGTSKSIVETLSLGDNYSKVMKVYSVSIVYFDVGEGDDYVYHGRTEFKGIHTHHVLKLKDRLTVGNVAGDAPSVISEQDVMPEYFLIPLGCFKGAINDEFDEWIYAIKNQEVPDHFASKNIQVLREKLDVLSMTTKEHRAYRRYMEAMGSDKGTLENAKQEGRDEIYEELMDAKHREEDAFRQKEDALRQKEEAKRREEDALRQKEEERRQKEEERHQKEEAFRRIEELEARLKEKG